VNRRRDDKPVRWYEQQRWPYQADRRTVTEYADWLKLIRWKLFCTFTFAWRVSDPQADKTFAEFVNRLERFLKSDVGYVRGDEKRLSGCGKPASARHYHVLLTSAAPMSPAVVEWLWKEMAGNRSDDGSAQVELFDANQHGISYILKFVNQIEGDWAFRKLHLFHPWSRSMQTPNKRWRRHLRRHKAREERFQNEKPHKVWLPA